MRGRSGGGDPDFGSDSFLDIIANLVGVLIVLIVLAGLRAGRAPVESELTDETEPPSATPAALPVVSEPEPVTPPALPVAPAPEPPIVVATEPVEEQGMTLDAARRQIAAAQEQVAALQTRLDGLDIESSQNEVGTLQRELAARATRVRTLRAELERSTTQSGLLVAELKNVDREYQQLRMRLVETNTRLEQMLGRKRPEKQLELRINPVGRRSTGEEILFRVEDGRVVHLPVSELVETAVRLERNSMASIMSGRTRRGVAGPVDGITFTYEYGVATVPTYSSSGQQSYSARIRLRGLVKTLPGAPSEPIGRALANGGIVERLLLQAKPGTVVRLAVSTDSFADARRIAAYARDLNFTVASRPIEPGTDLPVHLSDRSNAIAQ
jgi:hypothetical protein